MKRRPRQPVEAMTTEKIDNIIKLFVFDADGDIWKADVTWTYSQWKPVKVHDCDEQDAF